MEEEWKKKGRREKEKKEQKHCDMRIPGTCTDRHALVEVKRKTRQTKW